MVSGINLMLINHLPARMRLGLVGLINADPFLLPLKALSPFLPFLWLLGGGLNLQVRYVVDVYI